MYEYINNQTIEFGGRKLSASELTSFLDEKSLEKLVNLKVIKKLKESKDGTKQNRSKTTKGTGSVGT